MNWSLKDDRELLTLIKNKKIDPFDFHSAAIERVRAHHFPERQYRSFAPLYQRKIRKWAFEQTLAGKWKGVNPYKIYVLVVVSY